MGCVAEVAELRTSPRHQPVGPAPRRIGLWALSCSSAHIRACCRAHGASTAAPDIGPAHHASTCSTFLSFRLRAFAKWPIWPCGGRQHRISVLRITLLHALLSFPFVYEHSRSGRYGRVVDGSTGYRSCASCFNLLCFPLLCFAFLYECSRSGRYGRVVDGSTGYQSCTSCFSMLYFPFCSFLLQVLVKWPIWPCGGRRHQISVPRISCFNLTTW